MNLKPKISDWNIKKMFYNFFNYSVYEKIGLEEIFLPNLYDVYFLFARVLEHSNENRAPAPAIFHTTCDEGSNCISPNIIADIAHAIKTQSQTADEVDKTRSIRGLLS